MAFQHTFIAAGTTPPHWPSVLDTLRQTDASAGLQADGMTATIDKASAWTAAQIAGVQNVIDNAPRDTDQIRAQFDIDGSSIMFRALLLTMIDQFNVLRSQHGLADITPQQAIAAVRAKAGTL